MTYGDVRRADEVEQSTYCFREADPAFLRQQFERVGGERRACAR